MSNKDRIWCPWIGCRVNGTPPGLKRHLAATHNVRGKLDRELMMREACPFNPVDAAALDADDIKITDSATPSRWQTDSKNNPPGLDWLLGSITNPDTTTATNYQLTTRRECGIISSTEGATLTPSKSLRSSK